MAFRIRKWNSVSGRPYAAETCAWIFGTLILIAYLRTPGFYRYFFYANVAAILAFPAALELVLKNLITHARSWNTNTLSRDLTILVCVGLVTFQTYHMFTKAYISRTYTTTQIPLLEQYFGTEFESWRQPYVYDAPEIVPFLTGSAYSQYIEGSESGQFAVGIPLEEALASEPGTIILNEKRWYDEPETFSRYETIVQLQHYVVAGRIREVRP